MLWCNDRTCIELSVIQKKLPNSQGNEIYMKIYNFLFEYNFFQFILLHIHVPNYPCLHSWLLQCWIYMDVLLACPIFYQMRIYKRYNLRILHPLSFSFFMHKQQVYFNSLYMCSMSLPILFLNCKRWLIVMVCEVSNVRNNLQLR